MSYKIVIAVFLFLLMFFALKAHGQITLDSLALSITHIPSAYDHIHKDDTHSYEDTFAYLYNALVSYRFQKVNVVGDTIIYIRDTSIYSNPLLSLRLVYDSVDKKITYFRYQFSWPKYYSQLIILKNIPVSFSGGTFFLLLLERAL